MTEVLASYTLRGQPHEIALVPVRGRRLVIDRAAGVPARLVAELERDEGPEHALALLHGDGAYLERARAGETGLCRELDDPPAGRRPAARAA